MFAKTLPPLVAVAVLMSGCVGGGTNSQVAAMPQTAVIPTEGTATYKGKFAETYREDGTDIKIKADMQLDADFGSGIIEGKMSNFSASGNGTTVPIGGQMTGFNGLWGNSRFNLNLGGTLTVDSRPFTEYATVDGVFKGANAEGVEATVATSFDNYQTSTTVYGIRN